MKPRFIFSAVGVMCVMMLFTLPSLARIPRTGAVSAAPAAANISAPVEAIQGMAAAATVPAPEQAAAPAAVITLPAIDPAAVPRVEGAAVPPEAVQPEAAQPPAQPTQAPAGDPNLVDPFVNAGTAIANAAIELDSTTLDAQPPELQSFTASVVNGQADTVVGVYVPGVLALPVLQQPGGDGNYISDQEGTVTQFAKPAQYGVTALLAHNFLSGRLFFHIKMNQEFYVIFGDGDLIRYRVSAIQSYQALSPYDAQSQFVDLNVPGAPVITHSDLFQRVYTTSSQVVLQTCIEANGEPSWGRIFIIADPI